MYEKLIQNHDYFKQFENQERLIFDSLTGVFNRTIIMDYAAWLSKRKQEYSLCIVDLDNFKNVNDTYGHLVGDTVLKSLSSLLVKELGDKAVVGRFGGDEFILICENITEYSEIWQILHNLIFNVARITFNDIPDLRVTSTVGCARCPIDSRKSAEIFEMADKALYRGKLKGRSCFIIYLAEKHASIDLKSEKDKTESNMDILYTTLKYLNTNDISYGVSRMLQYLSVKLMFDDICLATPKGEKFKYLHSTSKMTDIIHVPYELINEYTDNKGIMNTPVVENLVDSSEKELSEALTRAHCHSCLCVKIRAFGEEYGYIRVDATSHIRVWQQTEMGLLISASNALGILLHYNKITIDDLKD